jgi:alanine racemase
MPPPYPIWLEINLSAIEHNTRQIRSQTNTALMAVVKANAYGMGAVEVSQAILTVGAEYLAVARGCEVMALRRAGIQAPTLLFGVPVEGEIDALIAEQTTLTLTGYEALDYYTKRAEALQKKIKVHLKVDTGMGRFGVMAEEALELAHNALASGWLDLEGIYMHFPNIDTDPNDPLNALQISRFKQALDALNQAGIQPRWVHTANSGAALGHPETRFNMVRLGSALVSIRPFYYLPFPPYLRRVLAWKTVLTSCRVMPEGWGISYGQTYHTGAGEVIGVIPAGYADGFRRSSKNEVLIDGQRLPVVGRVCADMAMIKLPHRYPLGTEVVLLGQQGTQSIQIEDLSERWNTAQADVVANINPRVERIYIRD